jgi:dihydrofolate reductase
MRKLIACQYASANGVVESPEEWQFPYYTADVAAFNVSQILAADAFVLGRATYEIFAAFWPLQTNNEFGVADKLNGTPKFVVSTTLRDAAWAGTTIISANVIQELNALKQQPGSYMAISGSLTLVESLAAHNLIDEYRFLVHPIFLRRGRRALGSITEQVPLKLLDSRTFSSGVVLLSYAPA